MFIEIAITPEQAQRLYDLYSGASMPLDLVDISLSTVELPLLPAHIRKLGAECSINYPCYLTEMPQELIELEADFRPLWVALRRRNSKPTRSNAGYYRHPNGTTAEVETTFKDVGRERSRADWVQNITVRGPNLQTVLNLHGAISTGDADEHLVQAFE